MKRFCIFIDDNKFGYNRYIKMSADNAVCVNSFEGVVKKVFELHFSWKLNAKRELPFKSLWYRKMLKNILVDRKSPFIFVFFESYLPSYSSGFLRYLKEMYPNSKNVFVAMNPITAYTYTKLSFVKAYYDIVVTFVKEDADKYGYSYYPYAYPYYIPFEKEIGESNIDVLFVGADKGRLEKLITIYEYLTSKGYNCEFYISGVSDQEQKYRDMIHYNTYLAYDEVINKVRQSKCILEIIQGDYNYCSLRMLEAMLCHKKLLTTNKRATELSVYDPRYIQILDDNKPIELTFIDEKISDDVFPKNDFCSFASFETFIDKSLGVDVHSYR